MQRDTEKFQMDVSGYEIVAFVQGSVGEEPMRLGIKGRCRYCGSDDMLQFNHISHSLPEALGNKWIVSQDECDACNILFSRYDDALAKSVGSVLTVSGTRGKNGHTRQTGRSNGPSVIRHSRVDGHRNISVHINGTIPDPELILNPLTRKVQFVAPTGMERFVPRDAYKALVKMAIALVPEAQLCEFSRAIAALRSPISDGLGKCMVGLSFGSVGNAPPLAAAALLRRVDIDERKPYMLFLTSMGSVCFQIALKSDNCDAAWNLADPVCPSISWSNTLGHPSAKQTRIDYGPSIELDWSGTDLSLSPIEALRFDVDLATSEGRITPLFRLL